MTIEAIRTWILFFAFSATLGSLTRAAESNDRSGKLNCDAEYWKGDTTFDVDPPSGKFQDGTEVVVTGDFLVDGSLLRYVKLKDGSGAGWIRAHEVTLTEKRSAYLVPTDRSKLNNIGFETLRKNGVAGENLLVSPYGAWTNLRVVQQGSRGKSREEVDGIIGPVVEGLQESFTSKQFRSVDCVIKKEEIEFADSFVDYSKALEIELRSNKFDDTSRRSFNDWIYEESEHRIQDFFSTRVWNKEAEALIVNVSSFRGEWLQKFSRALTQEAEFHLNSEKTANVQMMATQGEFCWLTSKAIGCDGVVLPYRDSEMAAVVLVPDSTVGLPKFVKRVSGEAFESLFTKLPADISLLPKQSVLVMLPRVKFCSELSLNQVIGLKQLASNEADLSGLFDSKRVKISRIMQKSCIDITEDGTEAVSVTATEAIAAGGDGKPPTQTLIVDRPFLFTIVHWPSKAVLFVASVSNPASSTVAGK